MNHSAQVGGINILNIELMAGFLFLGKVGPIKIFQPTHVKEYVKMQASTIFVLKCTNNIFI